MKKGSVAEAKQLRLLDRRKAVMRTAWRHPRRYRNWTLAQIERDLFGEAHAYGEDAPVEVDQLWWCPNCKREWVVIDASAPRGLCSDCTRNVYESEAWRLSIVESASEKLRDFYYSAQAETATGSYLYRLDVAERPIVVRVTSARKHGWVASGWPDALCIARGVLGEYKGIGVPNPMLIFFEKRTPAEASA